MIAKAYKIKSFITFSFFLGIMLLLGYRIFSIQVLGFNKLARRAKNMHQIEISLLPKRGYIYDRNKTPLAMSVPEPSLYADPSLIKDPYDTAGKLSALLGIDKGFIYKQITKNKRFVWIKRKLSPELKTDIQALRLPGLNFVEEAARFYPKGMLASHILGFVNIDNKGMAGIELLFDKYLTGREGLRITEKDAEGREVISWRNKNVPQRDGCNIILTIDEVIQYITEQELDNAVEKYHPKSASAIVMNPYTGAVLAMSSRPSFDPNKFNKADPRNMRNRAITDCFEPGSVFKMFTAGAALNERLFGLKDTIFCENGSYRVPGGTLHDHRAYGILTFQQVIEKSSNIGIAKIAQKLGKQKLYQYLSDFGFGRPTGILLPGEIRGIFRSPGKWSGMSITRIPMGHEVAATAIQITTAACAIANGGKLLRPLIIKKITDSRGISLKEYRPKVVRDILTPSAVMHLKTALKGVTGPHGTAPKARVSGFETAGKTGTAQKLRPDGTYSHSDFMASFVGFVPADKPYVTISVVLDSPKPVYYGGQTAAPVFRKIAEKTIAYLTMGNTAVTEQAPVPQL